MTNRKVLAQLILCADNLSELVCEDFIAAPQDLIDRLQKVYDEINLIYQDFYELVPKKEVEIPLEKLSYIPDNMIKKAFINYFADSDILYITEDEQEYIRSADAFGYDWLDDEEFLLEDSKEKNRKA